MAPLFSLMVSFDPGATEKVDLDAAVIRSPVLQWICRMIFGGQEEVAPFGSYLKSCPWRFAVILVYIYIIYYIYIYLFIVYIV